MKEHRVYHEMNIDGTPGCGADLSGKCLFFQLPMTPGKMMTIILAPLLCLSVEEGGCGRSLVAAPSIVQVASRVPSV